MKENYNKWSADTQISINQVETLIGLLKLLI